MVRERRFLGNGRLAGALAMAVALFGWVAVPAQAAGADESLLLSLTNVARAANGAPAPEPEAESAGAPEPGPSRASAPPAPAATVAAEPAAASTTTTTSTTAPPSTTSTVAAAPVPGLPMRLTLMVQQVRTLGITG